MAPSQRTLETPELIFYSSVSNIFEIYLPQIFLLIVNHLREALHKVFLGWFWSLGRFRRIDHLLELLVADPAVTARAIMNNR